MITFVNKKTGAKIIVPEANTEGMRYYIIDANIIQQHYTTGDMYLDKDKWEIENN